MLMSGTVLASNFLVPNATFVVELVVFILILWVLRRYVIPPINKAMTDRQERIRLQFEESEQAKADARAAEDEYREALVEARHEAARIREEAREQGAAIMTDMREQAHAESARITAAAHAQIEAERQQVLTQLRAEVGALATTLAGRIVGESLEDEARQRRTVERFIDEVESADSSSSGQSG
jgi:F-type H+-transporting ATPase subunit b